MFSLRDFLSVVGKGQLRRSFPLFDAYCKLQGRLEYLNKVREHFIAREDNTFLNRPSDVLDFVSGYFMANDKLSRLGSSFFERDAMYQAHVTYVSKLFALLDINNTMDHSPFVIADEGSIDTSTGELYGVVTVDLLELCKEYFDEWPMYVLDGYFDMPVSAGTFYDEVVDYLLTMQCAVRKQDIMQRLKRETHCRHADGWFMVFDTLTLAPDQIASFMDNQKAIRNYTRGIGRKVNVALGRRARDSYSDVYRYFIVPEYGDKNGRLHFHCIHLMATLPLGTVDPNIGRYCRDLRQVGSLRGLWEYGHSMPIAVRYAGDAFTVKRRWLWPTDKDNKPISCNPVDAVLYYVTKYVSKAQDERLILNKSRGQVKWKKSLKTLQIALRSQRVSMSRGFGMIIPSMANLSLCNLVQLTKLHWSVTPYNMLITRCAKKEIASRKSKLPLVSILGNLPQTKNFPQLLRDLMRTIPSPNWQSFIPFNQTNMTLLDISNECFDWLSRGFLLTPEAPRFERTGATK